MAALPEERGADALLHMLVGHTRTVKALALSRDGRALFSASSDATVRQWSPATGECMATLSGHLRPVLALALSDSLLLPL